MGARVADFLARVPPSESATERAQLEQAATELFGNQRDLIGTLRTHYEAYVKELLRLDSSTGRLLAVTESYGDFIREHILWVPSIDDPFSLDAREFRDSALWLLRGDPEREELAGLGRDVAGQWYLSALLAAILGAALAARRRGVRRIDCAAPLVQRAKTDTLSLTAQVLGWTLVAALPFPLLVLGAGQIVEQNIGDSTWRLGWATVLARLVVFLVPATVLLQTLRPNGLARVHFRWPDEPCRALSAAVRRYAIPALVADGAQLVIQYASDPAYRESTGRLLGLVAVALWGVFAWRVLAPKGPVLEPYYTRNPDSLITRSRVPIFLFGVGMPAALCMATVIGYVFTVRVFGGLLVLTYLLVFGLLLVHGLAMRWLFFHRRRLAVDQATQRRREKEEQKATEGAATEPEVDPDEDVDIPALHADTRMLFRAAVVVALIVGLLSIWSETLPALKRLDRVQLWPSVRLLSVAETDAATAVRPAVATESGDATPGASAAGTPSIPGMPPLTTVTSAAPTEMAGESGELLPDAGGPAGLAHVRPRHRRGRAERTSAARDRCAHSAADRRGRPIRHRHHRALRADRRRRHAHLRRAGYRLVVDPVARRRPDLRTRLRPAGDLRQLHLGPDPAPRAADPRRRHRDDRRGAGDGRPDSHTGHDDPGLQQLRAPHTQQEPDHGFRESTGP